MRRNNAGGRARSLDPELVAEGPPGAPSGLDDTNGGLGTARPTGEVWSWVGRGVTTAPSVAFASFILLVGLLVWPALAFSQLALVPEETPATIFAGQPAAIRVVFRNPGETTVETDLTTRLYQVASGVRMPVGDAKLWKKLTVLPNQTVVESFSITVPEIKTSSRFQIEWTGIGRTEVTAHPVGLLKQLHTLVGDQPLAVYDPDGKLRPVLKKAGVEFTDFETETVDARLALVWSEKRLPASIATRAKKGLAVVWIRPQPLPAFGVRWEAGTVMLVPALPLIDIADSPLAQGQLLRWAELALQPERWEKLLTERN